MELKKKIPAPRPFLRQTRGLLLILLLTCPSLLSAQLTVYPGDANNNGLCSHVDVLYLGLAFGATGPSRQGSAGINWGPHILQTPWNQTTLDAVNYGYIDCDGSGMVDSSDIGAIIQNFGETVSPAGPGDTAHTMAGGGAAFPTLSINLPSDTVTIQGQMTFTIDIGLGSAFFPVDSLYGIAFTISYDPSIVDSVTVDPHGGWLANSGLTLRFAAVDTTLGLIYMSITNTDHMNRSGFGTIGSIGIVMDDNIRVSSQYDVQLGVSFIRAMTKDGLGVWTKPDQTTMTVLTSREEAYSVPRIDIFPVPATSRIQVSAPDLQVTGLSLLDISGNALRTFAGGPLLRRPLDVTGLMPGVYFLELRSAQGTYRKKLLLMP